MASYDFLCLSGGQAKTLMFVHIAPEHDALGETISTLKFAERVATVELGAAKVNKDSSSDVRELKEQVISPIMLLTFLVSQETYYSCLLLNLVCADDD